MAKRREKKSKVLKTKKDRAVVAVRSEQEVAPMPKQAEETVKPFDIKEQNVMDKKEFRFPHGYGDNRIIILIRDPWWIFS
ncbi:MAG: hypothetical protein KJ994_01860, partial [Candidatus Omnitrophica bacterium]|nr:hypothetical protein [Candidatus Omnitrophota bacterium]